MCDQPNWLTDGNSPNDDDNNQNEVQYILPISVYFSMSSNSLNVQTALRFITILQLLYPTFSSECFEF